MHDMNRPSMHLNAINENEPHEILQTCTYKHKSNDLVFEGVNYLFSINLMAA